MGLNPLESPDSDPLENFLGITRLFPLPNVVLFPGALLPLHIFEPRYRQMVADAMDDDRLITMVLLKPGHDDDYEGSPPIHKVGCIGRIIQHEPLPDGKSNILLQGLSRVRIRSEDPDDRLYRIALVRILKDRFPPGGPAAVATQVERVIASMKEILNLVGRGADAEKLASASGVPAGRLCDLACHCLGFDTEVKQTLLNELNVGRRAETLLAWMDALLVSLNRRLSTSTYPPEFSKN